MTISANARRRVKHALVNADAAVEVANTIDALPTLTTVEETLTLTNAVKKDMTAQIPAGAVITSVSVNLQTAVTGDASGDNELAKVGVGITGNVIKYGHVAALTKNAKSSVIPTHAVLASAETLGVYAIKTDGSTAATEKFVAGGIVKIRVTYATPYALPNA